MSVADDFECVSKVVQQSEKFICGEIGKIQQELKKCNQSLSVCQTKIKEQDVKIQKLELESIAQGQRISRLQTEKQSMLEQIRGLQALVDSPNAHSACRSAIQKAFASALQSVLPDSNVAAMDTSVTDTSVLQPLPSESMAYVQLTSTPLQQLPVPDPQMNQACRVTLGKRKSSATSE